MDAIGALLLRDPAGFSQAGGSWAAVRAHDAEQGEVIESVEHFVRDHRPGVWLTNVSGYTLRSAGFGRRTDLKHDGFLSVRVSSILDELGLKEASAEVQARTVAGIFRRVLALGTEAMGLDPMPDADSLSAAIFKRFFRRPRTGDLAPEVRMALANAVQAATFSSHPRGVREGPPIVLRHPRHLYAARLMATRVPFGEWAEIPPPRDPEAAVRWALDLLETRPLLLKVDVSFRGERAHELALLSNMGSGSAAILTGQGRQANPRSWVAGPEFVALQRFAQVRIHAVLAADQYSVNPWAGFADAAAEIGPKGRASLACGPLVLHGRAAARYETGLLAECCAFSWSPGDTPDPVSAWIASHDRALLLEAAAAVLVAYGDTGVRISGFQRGRLWVRFPEEDLSVEEIHGRVARICAGAGLQPPVLPVPRPGSEVVRVVEQLKERFLQSNDPCLVPTLGALLGRTEMAMANGAS